MDALAWLLELPSWRDALRVAHKYTSEGLEAYRLRAEAAARAKPLPRANAEVFHRNAYKERRVKGETYIPVQWYYDRGIDDGMVQYFLLGHDGSRFTIPVFGSESELLNIRFRKDEVFCTEEDYFEDGSLKMRYSGVPGRNGTYLYPELEIASDTRDWIVICEGELDAVRLYQESIPAATTTNGAGNIKHILKHLSRYGRIKKLYIALDQDEPGQFASKELAELAREAGYTVFIVSWLAQWGKDITALYQNNHSLDDAVYRSF